MPERLNDETFQELLPVIQRYLGDGVGNVKKQDIIKSVGMAAARLDIASPEALARNILLGDVRGLDLLAEYLTIGESYFFRHKECLDLLITKVMPGIIATAEKEERDIAVWSAACANGEEPYSLAIMFEQLILPKKIKIKIYASDVNQSFLKRAQTGIYTEWAFRELPDSHRSQYFEKLDKYSYELVPRIRKRVEFFHYNLLHPFKHPLPCRQFDVILCRNVLIYFNEKQVELVMHEFDQCLTEHGWILTSPAEVGGISRKTFKAVNLDGNFFLRRTALVKPDTIITSTTRAKHATRTATVKANTPPVIKKHQPQETVHRLPATKEPEVKTDYTQEELLHLAGKRDSKISSTLAAAITRLCADRGMQTDAIYWSEVAINKDKFNPSYYHLHAQIMQDSGDTAEACKTLNQALFIDPEYIAAYFSLGMIYFSSGDHRNAKRNFKNAEKLLAKLPENTVVPDCDELTAGMITKLINNILRNHVTGKDKA